MCGSGVEPSPARARPRPPLGGPGPAESRLQPENSGDTVRPKVLTPIGRTRSGREPSTLRPRRLAVNLIVSFAAISNLYLLAGYTLAAAFQSPLMFRPRGEYLAAEWLQAHAARSEPVLGTYPTSNLLPAVAGVRTVIGHWNLTPDFYSRKAQVEEIYAGDTGAARRDDLLRALGAQYVYLGPSEMQIGGWRPDGEGRLAEVYHNADVTIYRVRP